MSAYTDRINRVLNDMQSPVDAASSAVFRIGFGLIAAWWSLEDLVTGRVTEVYSAPRFHLTYCLFDFVRPLPGNGLQWLFAGLFVLAVCIAAGFCYRIASILFALGFTYFFLLDRTNYQNHYYLIALLSWVLVITPLHHAFSVDALWNPSIRSGWIPRWSLWLLRFHIGLPYFFGGIAKIQPDWFAGEPLRMHLRSMAWPSSIQTWATSELTIGVMTWGGLIFDLTVVPLLLFKPTRSGAYGLCVGFHLVNACLFDIHIFPWFMIIATTIFFPPDWPRRLLPRRMIDGQNEFPHENSAPLTTARALAAVALALYCATQIALPVRPFFYPGQSAWTERGHHFSWRMMLRSKTSALRYYVTDPMNGRTGLVDLRKFVTATQLTNLSRDPEMILHLGQIIASEFRRKTGRDVEVRALVLTSLNGRKPELLIDPHIDLAKQERGFSFRSWIMPQREPLRSAAWSIPITEWERYVVPPLSFSSNTGSGKQ